MQSFIIILIDIWPGWNLAAKTISSSSSLPALGAVIGATVGALSGFCFNDEEDGEEEEPTDDEMWEEVVCDPITGGISHTKLPLHNTCLDPTSTLQAALAASLQTIC